MLRSEVADFVRLGPLPDSEASEERIALHQVLLQASRKPVTNEEAEALIHSFGPDDCYGLGWTLLHIIESAPKVPAISPQALANSEWLQMVWKGPRQ